MENFDTTRIARIKSCFETIIEKLEALSQYCQSVDNSDGQEMYEALRDCFTEWRESADRLLNGTARIEVNKENLFNWLDDMKGKLDELPTLLLLPSMDPDLAESAQLLYEELDAALDQLDALVRSERELYRQCSRAHFHALLLGELLTQATRT